MISETKDEIQTPNVRYEKNLQREFFMGRKGSYILRQ